MGRNWATRAAANGLALDTGMRICLQSRPGYMQDCLGGARACVCLCRDWAPAGAEDKGRNCKMILCHCFAVGRGPGCALLAPAPSGRPRGRAVSVRKQTLALHPKSRSLFFHLGAPDSRRPQCFSLWASGAQTGARPRRQLQFDSVRGQFIVVAPPAPDRAPWQGGGGGGRLPFGRRYATGARRIPDWAGIKPALTLAAPAKLARATNKEATLSPHCLCFKSARDKK